MPKVRVCVFNQTRQSFLSLNTTVADGLFGRLKGLLGHRVMGTDHGVWLIPSHGVHTFGLLIPIDVVYLDREFRVLETVENVGPFRMTPYRADAASVLELPVRTIHESQTQPGDRISIWSPSQAHSDQRLPAFEGVEVPAARQPYVTSNGEP